MNFPKPIWAYAAGFLEGDGSLGVSRWLRKGAKQPSYVSWVSVHNTEKAIPVWFQKLFGGRLTVYRSTYNKTRFKGKKKVWAWQLPLGGHTPFLTGILPYLKGVKKKRAEVILRFRKIVGRVGVHADLKKQNALWRSYRACG